MEKVHWHLVNYHSNTLWPTLFGLLLGAMDGLVFALALRSARLDIYG